ncbi:CCA tRNA nucleotidyltransferase [Bacillus sp. M6-12]|uniref:CCA tRNA nucleotidyltransferase n=1 Tax=Bacillus sp. M6-12 TaxID=2054166 RepID=UPI000C7815DA|nr:HD domain-containing protein [Bacillus sp. M6-12]PLS19636.1 CCA tRNA nucleotidyltransferase [Bacillus sp. M6-12]
MGKELNKELETLKKIAEMIVKMGGQIYFVGGYVRDFFTGKENKDIDVEVYGLSPKQLKQILSQFGEVDEVGASFGVYMVHGLSIDFALPRREIQGKVIEKEERIILPRTYEVMYMEEIKTKYPTYEIQIHAEEKFGHKDFIVIPDPFMSLKEATIRRDFTMNAMMKDVLTCELIDIWSGRDDIESQVIRHIDDKTFVEDPLRVLRACQFASRFEFSIDQETKELCQTIDLSSLAKERIFAEVEKALMKSMKPSIALEYMRELLVVEKLFPELEALIHCLQDPVHHAEGTVWNHTKMVLDIASSLKGKTSNPTKFMFGSLCHDMGKPNTTKEVNGRISSHGHEAEGEKVAEVFMKRITTDKRLIEGVKELTKHHMRLLSLYPNGSDKAIRKLSLDTNIQDLRWFSEADYRGRGLVEHDFTPISLWFEERTKEVGADKEIQPLLTGKDLIEKGLKPGKEFGILLQQALEYQLEGYNKEQIIDRLFA